VTSIRYILDFFAIIFVTWLDNILCVISCIFAYWNTFYRLIFIIIILSLGRKYQKSVNIIMVVTMMLLLSAYNKNRLVLLITDDLFIRPYLTANWHARTKHGRRQHILQSDETESASEVRNSCSKVVFLPQFSLVSKRAFKTFPAKSWTVSAANIKDT